MEGIRAEINWNLSDLFLCQSEHEGGCVPLVESMFFEKPVVAYDCCAIGETLGKGGITLFENFDWNRNIGNFLTIWRKNIE